MPVLRILIHIAPLAIFLSGHVYLAVAALLFVGVCYIKVKKLSNQVTEAQDGEEKASLLKARKLWLSLTFLRGV